MLAKLRPIGNSTGLSLTKKTLSKAGFKRGDSLSVETFEGKIILCKVDSDFSAAMKSLDNTIRRYPRTLARLSK